MSRRADAPRDLLFGLLALQNGMIDQAQLVAAFAAWTRAKDRPMADVLVEAGALTEARRRLLDALVDEHAAAHGGAERSLAKLNAGKSTIESLAAAGGSDPEAAATLQVVGKSAPPEDRPADATMTYSVGAATSEGQRFRVLRPHALGGLGAVFVALDGELHREVALKQILDQHADDEISRLRFMLEAEITGGLEHPGIVPVYGLGSYDDGRPYYAMRFIRGDSLKEAIEEFHAGPKGQGGARALELKKLLRRFLDVCNALQYAHDRGVLHRDVKPGNVIVGKHGETLVIDWGLAKPMGHAEPGADVVERPLVPASASGSADTLPGSALGTPAYMSPEQARGDLENLGPRSDVYSLGATLYSILVGRPPFVGDVGEVLQAVQKGKFTPPRAVDASVDRAIEAVCLTAMALKPEDRYASCRALADDVERYIADEPVSVHRESLATRATRWGRRHRTAAASAGVLLVSAVVGLSIGAVLINRERAKAEANFRQARAAVDRYFTTVSENRLLKVPGLQPLRKELLDAAQEYYRDFLRERGDDPSVRADAAAATFRVGWIDLAIGRPEEAAATLEKARALYEQVARERPADAELRSALAVAHGAVGLVATSRGRSDEALRAHRQALAIRESLARERPDAVAFQNDLARTHRNIGDAHRQVGATRDALAEWDEALRIARPLLLAPTADAGRAVGLTGRRDLAAVIREDLAQLHLDRAGLLRELGKGAEAEAALRESRSLADDLLRASPDDPNLRALQGRMAVAEAEVHLDLGRLDEAAKAAAAAVVAYRGLREGSPSVSNYRSSLAEAYRKEAWIQGWLGRPDEAAAAARNAVEVAEGLVRDDPDAPHYQLTLAESLNLASQLSLKRGDAAAALPLARRAVAATEDTVGREPKSVKNRSILAYTLRGLGRIEAALGHRDEAIRAFERSVEVETPLAATYPSSRYNCACTLALEAPLVEGERREALELRAVEALRQAFAAGYTTRSVFANDPDLDAIRRRDDFQALAREVLARK